MNEWLTGAELRVFFLPWSQYRCSLDQIQIQGTQQHSGTERSGAKSGTAEVVRGVREGGVSGDEIRAEERGMTGEEEKGG